MWRHVFISYLIIVLNTVLSFREYVIDPITGIGKPNGTYFQPYDTGFVGTYGDPKNFQRERTNEGSPGTADQDLFYGGAVLRQQCPQMVGPFTDGSYYCTAREFGYCDRRTGACRCNVGYQGIDCSECMDSHFLIGAHCFPKKLCPADCSGAGICDYNTGTCQCLPHRVGVKCETLLCTTHDILCKTCTVNECLKCASGYYLTADNKCSSCFDFDPRCAGCTLELGCTTCADSVLTSVRRSGYRKPADPDLPYEETIREFGIYLPFGTKSPESFADAENYLVVTTPQSLLRDKAISCIQGQQNDESWNCTQFITSHKVCGHFGVFTFVYPNYVVSENTNSIQMSVRRTGGGYGNVTINYFIKHFTTNDSDLAATAHYTTLQKLEFNEGVIERTFLISILNDNIVEENEVFQVVLEVPEGGGSVGTQFRTNITIIDDDAVLISAKLSKLIQNTTTAVAGQSFNISLQAIAANSIPLTMGGELFFATIENNLKMWESPLTKSGSQRNSLRHVCEEVDNGNGIYSFICPGIQEQGVYQLRVWHAFKGGIQAEYYYDGFFERLAVNRIDHNVNFTWGTGKLLPRGSDYITIRWTGCIKSNLEGNYQFYVDANDQGRLWIDGKMLIDHWHEQYVSLEPSRNVYLKAYTLYEVVMEYREITGNAYARLMWGYQGGKIEVIPQDNLYSLFEVDRSPVLVTIYSSESSPVHTECYGDGLYEGIALHQSYFTICPRDQYRNLRDDDDEFYLSSDLFYANLTLVDDEGYNGVGPEYISPDFIYNTITNCFDISYTPEIAGTYRLEILHDITRGEGRQEVAGSPFYFHVEPDKMSGPKSLLIGLPSTLYMEAGQCQRFIIISRDNAENFILKGGNNIQVYMFQVDHYSNETGVPVGNPGTSSLSPHIISPRPSDTKEDIVREGIVIDHLNGTYTAQICPVISGIHEIHVLLNGRGVSNQNFQILNLPKSLDIPLGMGTYYGEYIAKSPYYLVVSHTIASAYTTTAIGKGLEAATTGVPVSFMITVRDVYENVLRTASPSVIVTAKLDRSPNVVVNIWNYRNGSYEIEYNPILTGMNLISVYINGFQIKNSPFSVPVMDGFASANYSYAVGQGLHAGRTGDISYFEVYAFDLDNNRKTTYDDDYSFTVTGANNLTGVLYPCPIGIAANQHPICNIDDQLAGHYFGYFTPLYTGEITISVYLHTKHLNSQAITYDELYNSPFTALIIPSDPKAEYSDVTGTLYDNIAGVATTVNIQLRDYYRNKLISGGFNLELALIGVAGDWGTPQPLPLNQGLPNEYFYRGFYAGYPTIYGLQTDLQDGSYIFEYNIYQTGIYVLRIALAETGLNATYFNNTRFGYLFNEDFTDLSFELGKQGIPKNLGSTISWTGDIGGRPGIRGDLGEGSYYDRYQTRNEKNISVDLSSTEKNGNEYFNNNNNSLYTYRDDYWSARWTGMITPEYAEVYIFTVEIDDDSEVIMKIGGRGLENNGSEPGTLVLNKSNYSGKYNFTDTNYREFLVEYIHYQGEAKLKFYWESLSTPKNYIPTTAFHHWRNVSHYNTTIHPAPLCSHCSTVYGEALISAQVAVKKSFWLYARDEFDNLLQKGGDQPAMFAIGKDGIAFRGVVTDYGNSTYLIEYYPTQAGEFLMYITVGCCAVNQAVGYPLEIQQNAKLFVKNVPFLLTISSAPVDQTRSIAIGLGLIGGFVGDLLDFTMFYRDIYNNPTYVKDSQIQNIRIKIIEQTTSTVFEPINFQISYNSSNSTIQYTLHKAGKYLLYVYLSVTSIATNKKNQTSIEQYDGKEIIASPFQITMHSNKAIASNTLCRGLGLRQAIVSQESSFHIQLYDKYMNKLMMGGNRYYIRLQGDASFHHNIDQIVTPICIDKQDGSTTCSYIPLYTRNHQLLIKLLNNSISQPGGLGLTGYYYTTEDGAVSNRINNSTYTRIDPKISFYWNSGLMIPTSYNNMVGNSNNIPLTTAGQSIRWNGYLLAPRSDQFNIVAKVLNMNVSIFIDDVLVYDSIENIISPTTFIIDASYAIRIIAVANANYQVLREDGSISYNMYPMSIELRWSTPTINEYPIPTFFLYDSADDIALSPFPVNVMT